jgi:tetratricopeptide (TPR) repeat protein
MRRRPSVPETASRRDGRSPAASLLAASVLLGAPAVADEASDFLARGDEAHRAFRYAAAAEAYEGAHRLAPERFEVLERLSHIHADLGEGATGAPAEVYLRKGIGYAEELQRRFPDRADGYFWAAVLDGNLALLKGGKDKVRLSRNVERNARRAIEIDAGFAPAYVALGIYYREVAELSWVLRAFAKALFGGLPSGSREDSERMLVRAVELNPSDVRGRYQLALTYESLGRKDRAADELRRVLELPATEAHHRVLQKEARTRLAKLTRNHRLSPLPRERGRGEG